MHRLNSFILALVLTFGVPTLVHAQAPAPDARQAVPTADRPDDRDWGWLGLLGLAGLFGLMRRERAHDVRDRIATGTTR